MLESSRQPEDTYLVWTRFTYPDKDGPIDAVAVPNWVATYLTSGYSMLISLMMAQVWSILVGLVIFYHLRKSNMRPSALHPIAPTLWNRRADLVTSMIETFGFRGFHCRYMWEIGVFVLILAAWVGQTVVGITVPGSLILGNAAPVRPESIYVADPENRPRDLTAFSLEVPPALRALGRTEQPTQEIRGKVLLDEEDIGRTEAGEEILQFRYSYTVTGADMGLQKYPNLSLSVTGSCHTEYGWLNRTDEDSQTDEYALFNNTVPVSPHLDGNQPTANFVLGPPSEGSSNWTFGIIVSSAHRISYTPSTDPWYLTEYLESRTGANHSVRAGRPPLSCWQDDKWSYKGRTSTILNLTSAALPGLELSRDMQDVLAVRLIVPMIWQLGRHVQSSALKSATTSNERIFDAGASSIKSDLDRLLFATYIYTANVLSDMTLYPVESRSSEKLSNFARKKSGEVKDEIAGFVVFTPDVTAVSVAVLVTIPCVVIVVWILAVVLVFFTPVGVVNALDSNNMHQELAKHYVDATVKYGGEGAVWEM